MLSSYYRDIQLFRFNYQTREVYIFVNDEIQIIVSSNGLWRFLNETEIELEVEAKLLENLEKELEALISAIAQFLASTSGFSSRLVASIALLAIRAGIEDFGDLEEGN